MSAEKKKSTVSILKERFGPPPKEVLERIKKYNAVRAAIKKALKEGPKTVPEIASATGIPSPEVLWHVMSMKKYGLIAEHEDEMDYYSYRLAEGDEAPQGE
jgi:DNA-binding Lrp family transcriptional regulator